LGYEIDFLPVGDGERSGEAIVFRCGNLSGPRNEQQIVIIDGGTKESGTELVKHIREYYNTNVADLVVSTHPDADHSAGLLAILENLKVGQLLMHLPWKHSDECRCLFKNGRITEGSLKKTLQASLQNAYDLEQIAREQGVPIIEPFSDSGRIRRDLIVLSPSKSFYELQIANFRATPEPKPEVSFLQRAKTTVVEAGKKIIETLGFETLKDPEDNETSAENNSSVILLWNYNNGEEFFLFCGDAGALALRKAIAVADTHGIDFRLVKFIQLPHHGSKHNVGPVLLDKIVGPKLQEETKVKTAYVSVAKEDQKHPSRKVANAFRRRGA